MKSDTYKIEYLSINKVKLNPDNPRQIKDAKFKSLVKSLSDCPDLFRARPLLCSDRTGVLIVLGGNMRLRAAIELKYKKVPVIIMSDLNELQEKEIAIKDNGIWGEWDFDALSSWDDLPLTEWGVDLPEDWLKKDEPQDAESQIDWAEELNKKWQVKTGDLWQIGEHRLLCGDSTKREDVERVTGGEKIELVLTDPLYGIDIVKIKGAGGWVPARPYKQVEGDDKPFEPEFLLELGINQIIFGGNYFANKLPNHACWIVWDKREGIPSNNFADCEIAWTSFDSPARIYHHLWSGLLRKGDRKMDGISKNHPTQKPVGLFINILEDFSEIENIIVDVFLGSGTTMVACQNLNRKCRGIEISPAYCAVILERMATAFSGIEIRRLD